MFYTLPDFDGILLNFRLILKLWGCLIEISIISMGCLPCPSLSAATVIFLSVNLQKSIQTTVVHIATKIFIIYIQKSVFVKYFD